MTTEDFKAMAAAVPRQPGVYRFIDPEGTILYVGKAKNLRNRVASYFGERKDRQHRTRVMVKKAARIEFTIVNTEADALLLENALIKTHQPRYNVNLKDDKNYSYICIKKERFPRVFITRQVWRDGSTYFGPYTSKGRLKKILDLVKELFPLRTCKYDLSEKNIESGKFKVCLEYHIKNCEAPCVAKESEEAYNQKIDQVKNILRGNYGAVVRHFKGEMERLAGEMEFERAQQIMEKLQAFNNYQAKSQIVTTSIKDVDVFSIAMDEKEAYVNYIKIVEGAVIYTNTQELQLNLDDEDIESLLSYSIPIMRERFDSQATEIILDREVELPGLEGVSITVPKIGDKKKLLELSQKNAKYYLLNRKKQKISHQNRQTPMERVLKIMQEDLNMDAVPLHIECFDNSNISGTNPASACVVFKNGKPSKKDYRHYTIKTVEGPNDFASMEEVVHRRYRRLLDEGEPLPQLVIIDGGKGQLSSAMKSVRLLGIEDRMTVVGIAKKLEEIYYPNDSIPLHINKKSPSLKIIQQARDEAHRFSLRLHRNKRSKNFTRSELLDVPGIGEKTVQALIAHFGSTKKVKEATAAEIAKATNLNVAKKLFAHYGKG
ncbi:excinuclease ABC subunit C [Lewinellaceae bacterium SD302]|nr:excinuclease ABC subunit C [Lewinellaceae bacterium SD302]